MAHEHYSMKNQLFVKDTFSRRLSYAKACHPVLENVELPQVSNTDIMVETAFSAVSRGTERLVFSGQVPQTEWERMKCPHQSGDFSFPVSYGYACVGKVTAIGSKVTSLQIGQNVFVLHPHQERFVVDQSWANPIPSDIPLKRAVLSANMETALNAIWDGAIEPDHKVAVIGAGTVGLLTAYTCLKEIGNTPIIVDVNPNRRQLAERLGCEFMDTNEFTSKETILFNRLFHTSASQAGLQSCIDNAAFEARIIEMSWYGDKSISLNLGSDFHSKRLQIHSSQVGTISPSKRGTTSHASRMAQAMNLLKDDTLEHLLDSETQFENITERLPDILDPQSDLLCPVITYSQSE
jgi:2-desacetyl-2-hydroxyethyl bacteriochlorophyllide A dehydrogenase